MTDRDITNRPSTTRRDLRFAGTVAAGLCAGVLGVGAIAVPLVGWNDWPQSLPVSDGDPITLSDADAGAPRGGDDGGAAKYTPRATVTGPSGAVALVTAGGITAGIGAPGPTGATGSAPASAGETSGSTGARRSRSGLESVGRRSQSSASFGEGGFAQDADSDGDGISDDYEQAHGLDVNANDADADADGDGLSNELEFRLRSSANARDSNGDGVEDGADDGDGDAVPNGVEVALGTNP
ncbi:MAG TPA: hypothetical protein VK279_13995, partial [Solirubrobacteraceae bacterium]|nr:hypothetical protein [Solirubrobacteraceae bacterium]